LIDLDWLPSEYPDTAPTETILEINNAMEVHHDTKEVTLIFERKMFIYTVLRFQQTRNLQGEEE
jgi:hypothetical protein